MRTKPKTPRAARHSRLRLAMIVLLGWTVMAGATILLMTAPPEAPTVDPQEQAIRDRMAAWAVRDAEQWDEQDGDLTLAWDEARGHLAIVIDDTGRELELFEKLLALRFELSFSVLPGSPYTAGVQQRLAEDQRRPREILLHLPMEPLDPAAMSGPDADEDFLLASDSPERLRAKLRAAIERVPAATGINNHMGSRLTAERRAMDALMPVLRERGMYFFDSRTTPKTVAADRAEAAGVLTISRKVFLDHEPGRDAIRTSLAEAVRYARQEPTAVIAHPSLELVEVLREELPRLHAQGVGVYPLSRVIAGQRL